MNYSIVSAKRYKENMNNPNDVENIKDYLLRGIIDIANSQIVLYCATHTHRHITFEVPYSDVMKNALNEFKIICEDSGWDVHYYSYVDTYSKFCVVMEVKEVKNED